MIIKNLRLENNWSQEQLADLTNLSTRTIQRIEKEDKASLESMNLLASVFQLDVKELEEKIENKNSKLNDKTTSKYNILEDSKLIKFISINLMLFAINMFTGTGHLWFLYPLFGWGIPFFIKRYKNNFQD